MLEIENHLKEDALRIEKDETELNNAWHKMSIFDRESSIAQSLHQDVKDGLCMIKRHIRLKIIRKNWKELNIEDGMCL